MKDGAEPKLWRVTVSVEAEGDAYVWAESRDEAERVAKDEIELDAYDGWRTAHSVAVAAEDLGRLKDFALDERPYGDEPDGIIVASSADGCTLRDALRWMTRDAAQTAAYTIWRQAQVPLFEGVDPLPIPCGGCGKRYPAEAHAEDCEEKSR